MPRPATARTCRTPLLLLVALGAASALSAPPAAAAAPARLEGLRLVPIDAVTVTRVGAVPAPVVPAGAAPAAPRATSAPLSTWQVSFSGAPTPAAEATVRDAVATWSRLVASPVPIQVHVVFATTEPGVLGYAGAPHYRAGGIGDGTSLYPSALADALAGEDVAARLGGPDSDLDVTLSTSQAGLYYGTDGRPPAGTIDMETVMLHEIAHGLGFAGALYVDGAGIGRVWESPAVYDRFPVAAGRPLLSLPDGSAELGRALTGGGVTWSGAQAVTANGGAPVKLYAPGRWEDGSSYSHLDEGTYRTGSTNALLTPYVAANEVVAGPGPVALGMLRDMGWRTAATPLSAIDARYTSDAGLRATLGAPVGDEQADGDVRFRVYEHGRLYSSPAGVHAVQGAILGTYLAQGGHRALGAPTTDERATADGVARYNDFARGTSLFWRPQAGVYPIFGAIRGAWLAAGGAGGPLGYPMTGELPTADRAGRYNDFSSGGSVYWSPATGAHTVQGAVRAVWLAGGGATGPMGYPTTDEAGTASGARFNDFSRGGSLYWSPGAGVRAVGGAIRARWRELGGAAVLGHPVSDEVDAGDGVGRLSEFSAGATVTWSPATGAHEVHGAIRAVWLGTGGVRGVLGYPVTAESATGDGAGRYNDFSRAASVVWSPTTGAQELYGAIRVRWVQLGGITSYLGYPRTGEYAVPGGRRNDFVGGSITWTPATGPVDTRR